MLRLIVALAIALIGQPAIACEIPLSTPIAGNQTQSTENYDRLAVTFRDIAWDASRQGVLLAVRPFDVSWAKPGSDDENDPFGPDSSDPAAQTPLANPGGGTPLDAAFVARHYRRLLVHVGSVTVFAPQTMVCYKHDLKPAVPFANATAGKFILDTRLRLEASLTQAQWDLYAGPTGIGDADLTNAQRPIFEALLPGPGVMYVRHRSLPEPRPDGETESTEEIPISEKQRRDIRFRLSRISRIGLIHEDGTSADIPVFPDDLHDAHAYFRNQPESFAESMSMFGQPLMERLPNRLKPGDLDLKMPELNVDVPIVNVITVDDMTEAIRKVSGVEIYADRRIGAMDVAINAKNHPSARAADLLEALCRAVTATFRKIGPAPENPRDFAYVLTSDREGIAAERDRIAAWAQPAGILEEQEKARDEAAIRRVMAIRPPAFPPGYLCNPSPEAEKIIDDERAKRDHYRGTGRYTIPVSALTPAQRQRIADNNELIHQENDDAERKKAPRISTDRVEMLVDCDLMYVVPGLGDLEADTSNGANYRIVPSDLRQYAPLDISARRAKDKAKAFQLVSGKRIILAVAAPRSRAEADELATLAAKRGVMQVWIDANGIPPALLADCVAAGKAHRLPVGALVDLMRAPTGTLSPSQQNLDIFGQTGTAWAEEQARQRQGLPDYLQLSSVPNFAEDVLRPDQPNLSETLMARLAPIAQTPGLVAFILRQAAAPGYDHNHSLTGTNLGYSETNYDDYHLRAGVDFGYTIENRLQFLRSEGYDPVDLDFNLLTFDGPAPDAFAIALPPYFALRIYGYIRTAKPVDVSEAQKEWRYMLAQQQRRFLAELRPKLEAVCGDLPLYLTLSGGEDQIYSTGTYSLWGKLETLPAYRGWGLSFNSYRHQAYEQAIVQGNCPPEISESGFVASLMRRWLASNIVEPSQPSAATVVDLTAMPLAEALPLIKDALIRVH